MTAKDQLSLPQRPHSLFTIQFRIERAFGRASLQTLVYPDEPRRRACRRRADEARLTMTQTMVETDGIEPTT